MPQRCLIHSIFPPVSPAGKNPYIYFLLFCPTHSTEFKWLLPRHHLTIKLCAHTIMIWSWKSICGLQLKRYHLFDLDCASVDQNIQVNGSQCICLPFVFVILMKTQEVNSVDDLSMAKAKEASYRRWNRRRETQRIQDTWAGNLNPRERENHIPGESGRAGDGQGETGSSHQNGQVHNPDCRMMFHFKMNYQVSQAKGLNNASHLIRKTVR